MHLASCDWWRKWAATEVVTEEVKITSEGAGRPLINRFVDTVQEPRQMPYFPSAE